MEIYVHLTGVRPTDAFTSMLQARAGILLYSNTHLVKGSSLPRGEG
jgi:hypothetical protein